MVREEPTLAIYGNGGLAKQEGKFENAPWNLDGAQFRAELKLRFEPEVLQVSYFVLDSAVHTIHYEFESGEVLTGPYR